MIEAHVNIATGEGDMATFVVHPESTAVSYTHLPLPTTPYV